MQWSRRAGDGNSLLRRKPGHPLGDGDEFATDPYTIGVTNTDISNGKEVRQFRDHSYASNYSSWISLCANGESALSLQSDPNADGPVCDGVDHGKGVFHHDGTSAAASMVSAAAVLVLSINPNLNWKQVRSILCASAEKIDCDNTDPNGKWQYCGPGPQQPLPAACISLPRGLQWFSEWYGFSRPNVYEAVKLARSYSAPDEFVLLTGRRPLAAETLTRSNLLPPENLGVFLLLPRHGKGGWHGVRFCGPILAGGDFRVGSRVLKPRDFSRLGRRGCASQPRCNSVCTSDQHDEFDYAPRSVLDLVDSSNCQPRSSQRCAQCIGRAGMLPCLGAAGTQAR